VIKRTESQVAAAAASKEMGLLLMFFIITLFSGVETWAEDVTVNGITYSNITWGTVTPSTASIIYDKGIVSVNLSDLSPELQKRFNFNPTNDANYRAVEAQQEALRSQQRQEAWARAAEQRAEQKRKAAMERIYVLGTVEQSLGPDAYLVSLAEIKTIVHREYVAAPGYGIGGNLRTLETKSTQTNELGSCVITHLPVGRADATNFIGYARVSNLVTNLAMTRAGSTTTGTYPVYEWDGEK
jgi:hypothetical protein